MNKSKILLVDDDTLFLEELKSTLVLNGYDTDAVSNSAQVVKIADETKPDLIILDMKMDGKSGFQVADDLKNFQGTSHIPIIAMTGYFTDRAHKAFMFRIGIKDCILKPFNPADIITKIENNLTKLSTEYTNQGA